MEPRDETLWKKAKQRARFQSSLVSFVIISFVLWITWWLTSGQFNRNLETPWPLWPMLFMGVFLIIRYIKAYKTDEDTMAKREYEKLKNNQS